MSWPGCSLGHGPRHEKTQDGFLVLSHLDGLYVQDWLDKYRPDRNQCHGFFVEEELSQRRRGKGRGDELQVDWPGPLYRFEVDESRVGN